MGLTKWRPAHLSQTDQPWTSRLSVRPQLTRRGLLAAATILGLSGHNKSSVADNSKSRLVWGTHISLAPTWLDPAETGGVITPFMMLYAIHDALVKPMPNDPERLCLAES